MRPLGQLHLVVLQHGLWGTPEDMDFVANMLRRGTDPRRVVVLNSGVNASRLTYDGIDVLGDRLAALVMAFCDRLAAGGCRRVTAISFVSYSLGGLIARYAIGKLAAAGFFLPPTPRATQPRRTNAVSTATAVVNSTASSIADSTTQPHRGGPCPLPTPSVPIPSSEAPTEVV
ncbi:putative serine esterase-domain-containing protein, partial [Haematococcus lacustris]